MQDLEKDIGDLKKMSRHNPVYTYKCESVLHRLDAMHCNNLIADKFYRESLNTFRGEVPVIQLNSLFSYLACLKCGYESVDFDLETVLESRKLLCDYYAFYRKHVPVDFTERFNSLMHDIKLCMQENSEHFWDNYHLLFKCLVGTGSTTTVKRKVIYGYLSDIMGALDYACKKKSELFDALVQSKMHLFSDLPVNYDKLDVAQSYFIRECFSETKDEMASLFSQIIAVLCPASTNISEYVDRFVLASEFKNSLLVSVDYSVVLSEFQEELVLGDLSEMWTLGEAKLKETYDWVVEIMGSLQGHTIYNYALQTLFSFKSTSKLFNLTFDEVKSQLSKLYLCLEKSAIETFDKQEVIRGILGKWEEVHSE